MPLTHQVAGGVVQLVSSRRPVEQDSVFEVWEITDFFESVCVGQDRRLVSGVGIRKLHHDLIGQRQFDLIINATSAGLSGEMPELPSSLLTERSCCYDMVYGAQPTPFMRWAAHHAAWAVADGLGMLVEQAAQSFYLWRKVRPETRPVINQLREAMEASNSAMC